MSFVIGFNTFLSDIRLTLVGKHITDFIFGYYMQDSN